MTARFLLPGCALAFLFASWGLPAAADVLRVGGTGGAMAMMEYLGKPFSQRTGIAMEIVQSLGTTGGVNATADRVLDLAVLGRAATAAELGRGLVLAETLRTPYVLATSYPAPPSMNGDAIVGVFSAARSNWPDGSMIRLILRPRAESDNLALVAMFPDMAAALDRARRRPELPVAATDQDNATAAEQLPGSFIGTTYAQIVMEARNLRIVPINGVLPTVEAIENGRYPFSKLFHLVHHQQMSPAVRQFLDFLRSADGIAALREAGCLPGAE